MAQISYAESMQTSANNENQVGFLSLPKDGDEAIVRFMCDSVDDFVILTRHDVGQGKAYRTVNCLRTPHDPIEKCPFCAANINLKQSFYIYLIQYVKNDDGSVTPTARIWERGTSYATKLKGYIDNYGPLSQIMCKIIRHGTGLSTEYEIIPNLNPNIYPESVYPCKSELFEGYKVVGRAVLEKSAEEMMAYLQTGSFPEKPQTNEVAPQPVPQPAAMPTDVPFTVGDNYDAPVYNTSMPANMYQQSPRSAVNPGMPQQPVPQYTATPGWQQNAQQQVQRPVRTY